MEFRMTGNSPCKAAFTISNQEYPGLYQAADTASASAQKVYLLLQQTYLASLIIGGLMGMLTSLFTGGALKGIFTLMAIVLAIGLLILWIGRSRQDDSAWFDCRAIAESVKTATWRYMMIASPFQNHGVNDQDFISELQEIRKARPDCQNHLRIQGSGRQRCYRVTQSPRPALS